ncbi:MAG: hypothetical protein AAGK78_07215, partial [Planctomycetota bacterium]
MLMQTLERRRLLTTFFTVDESGSNVIDAGPGDDLIEFERRGDFTAIFVNGEELVQLGASPDTNLIIRGGEGDDTIILGKQPGFGVRIDGGPGDDLIGGGDHADLILGGPGNDTLSGNAGVDTLLGGDGDDLLDTGATEIERDIERARDFI